MLFVRFQIPFFYFSYYDINEKTKIKYLESYIFLAKFGKLEMRMNPECTIGSRKSMILLTDFGIQRG